MNQQIKIAIADDHTLYRKALMSLISASNDRFLITHEVENGSELISAIDPDQLPDIVLLDIDMPVMNGFETAEAIKKFYPSIKILIVTMHNDDQHLIKMLKLGVQGYLNKDTDPKELNEAILSIIDKGHYYTDTMTGKLISSMNHPEDSAIQLNDREAQFLALACSEMTYKEIADKMCLSPKTIDGYRAALFEKFEVKSRVGLVLYAIKNKLTQPVYPM